jgi:hypothetical protein
VLPFFQRSKATAYKDRKSGLGALLHADSMALRLAIFVAMSLVFFFFLKITERRIPHGLAPDTTEQAADTARSAHPH